MIILASYRDHFIIEHKNLVYDKSNNKSIVMSVCQYTGLFELFSGEKIIWHF